MMYVEAYKILCYEVIVFTTGSEIVTTVCCVFLLKLMTEEKLGCHGMVICGFRKYPYSPKELISCNNIHQQIT